ncbi:MAG: hypothetical protein RI101_04810 [Nitrospira sp.]|nr:hypothetical protein [Nitrospira sp.]
MATHFGADQWWAFDGWLCLNCGDVIDPVILTNRECHSNGSPVVMNAKGMRGARGTVSGKLIRLTR